MRRHPLTLVIMLTIVGAIVAGCGVNAPPQTQAQPQAPVAQAQATPTADILPTPPPMPTPEPQPPTATPAPAPGGASLAGGAVLLQNDFSNPADLAAFRVIDTYDVRPAPSIWQISDSALKQISDGEGNPAEFGTAAVTGDTSWTDQVVTASGYLSGNPVFGVVARASQSGFYIFQIQPGTSSSTVILSRFDAAKSEVIELAKTTGPAISERTWYKLTLSATGTSLEGSINGQPVISATDATLSAGQAGVYGYAQGNLVFDNLIVQRGQ